MKKSLISIVAILMITRGILGLFRMGGPIPLFIGIITGFLLAMWGALDIRACVEKRQSKLIAALALVGGIMLSVGSVYEIISL
ncbi:MAG: hypothetical protein E7001_06870 [Coriobacteriaceae bacterium]|nr:hypothetical protein [Coriobacteriaceae bacterium]